jgi:hypothetical protein
MTSKLAKRIMGQIKSQAKGAKRKEVITKGLGIAIAQAMKGETVRDRLLGLFDCNAPTLENTLTELVTASHAQQKEVTATGRAGQKAKKVIMASFSRVKTIVKAIRDKFNLDKLRKARSLDEMYALSVQRFGKRSKREPTAFTRDQFNVWAKGCQRILLETPGRNATPEQAETYQTQLARVETAFVNLLGVLSKHETLTRIPVEQITGLVQKRKQHLRKAA